MGIAETLDNILFTSTTSLFKAYGVQMSEAPNAGEVNSTPLCAVIGFTGQALCGATMLACPPEIISASRPAPNATDRDWLAELANQLLGRVKNRLLPYGVEIYASTPIVLRGERIAPIGKNGGLPRIVCQTPTGSRVTAWIDHVVMDAGKLEKMARGDEVIAREGEIILF